MYESHKEPLASKSKFYQRIFKNIIVAFIIMLLCLIIGVAGYHYTTGMPWMDAIHNASMILSGMGLVDVDKVNTDSAKLFSSFYALFSGIVFITNIGVILAPAIHRLLHQLHIQDK